MTEWKNERIRKLSWILLLKERKRINEVKYNGGNMKSKILRRHSLRIMGELNLHMQVKTKGYDSGKICN